MWLQNGRHWSQIQSCFERETSPVTSFKCPPTPHSSCSSSSMYLTLSILSIKRVGLRTGVYLECVCLRKFNYLYTSAAFGVWDVLVSRFTCGTSESKGWSRQTMGSSPPFPLSEDRQRERDRFWVTWFIIWLYMFPVLRFWLCLGSVGHVNLTNITVHTEGRI